MNFFISCFVITQNMKTTITQSADGETTFINIDMAVNNIQLSLNGKPVYTYGNVKSINEQLIDEITNTRENGLDKVRKLLKQGADINYQDSRGDTALICAVAESGKNSTEETVKLLIDSGANLNIQNKTGLTALMCAAGDVTRHSTTAAVRMLIDAGANLNLQDKCGLTALMMAASLLGPECTIEMLVGAGADLGCKDINGNTVFDVVEPAKEHILKRCVLSEMEKALQFIATTCKQTVIPLYEESRASVVFKDGKELLYKLNCFKNRGTGELYNQATVDFRNIDIPADMVPEYAELCKKYNVMTVNL